MQLEQDTLARAEAAKTAFSLQFFADIYIYICIYIYIYVYLLLKGVLWANTSFLDAVGRRVCFAFGRRFGSQGFQGLVKLLSWLGFRVYRL